MSGAKRGVLGVTRLSVMKGQDTTSPARQKEIIKAKARERGEEIVLWAEDNDVSASKFAPTQRPELSKMLARHAEYSEVIFWRLDRLLRSPADLTDMLRWAERHGKNLVSATESFDLARVDADDSAMDEDLAYLTAIFARRESKATSVRVKASHKYLRESGRWPGGICPYGYRPVYNPDGRPGWGLVMDEETGPIVREAVRRVIAGESVNSIAADFNRRRLLSPRDYARLMKGKALRCECGHEKHDGPCPVPAGCGCETYQERHAEWARASLQRILSSEALQGHAVHDGIVVRGDDGMPLERAKPLTDLDTWTILQKTLIGRKRAKQRTQTASGLLDVAVCGVCGSPLYMWVSSGPRNPRPYEYYKCKQKFRRTDDPARCNARMIPRAVLEDMTHAELLREIGKYQVMKLEVTSGDGHEKAIADVGQQIADLTAERYVRGVIRPDFDTLMARLQTEHARLAGLPRKPDKTRRVPTGQTFRQKWELMDATARRLFLRDSGVRVHARRGGWPSMPDTAGPLAPADVPRIVLAEHGDLFVVIELGGLRDLLERAEAA